MSHKIEIAPNLAIAIDGERVIGSKPQGLFLTTEMIVSDEDLKRLADRCLEVIVNNTQTETMTLEEAKMTIYANVIYACETAGLSPSTIAMVKDACDTVIALADQADTPQADYEPECYEGCEWPKGSPQCEGCDILTPQTDCAWK